MHDYMTTFTPFHSKLNISEKPQLYTIANPNVLSQTYLHILIGWPLYQVGLNTPKRPFR